MKSNIKIISLIFMVFSIFCVLIVSSNEDLISQDNMFGEDDPVNSELGELIDQFNSPGPLGLGGDDVRFIANESDNYIDLMIRKKEEIQSVLVIYVVSEYIEGKKFTVDYGLRALEYNSVNGNEVRLLNGVELGKDQNLYFLVDSTPEKYPAFGEAFKIRIPTYSQYGYTKENFGLVRMGEGTFIKIRAFDLPFADYSGQYRDNLFEISTVERFSGKNKNKKDERKIYSGKPVVTKDLFPNNGKPMLNKPNGDYVVIYIRYTDDSKFFKEFVYREYLAGDVEVQNPYKVVPFNIKDEPEDGHAVLLASIYQNGGKLVRAKMFFKMGPEARCVQISAIDGDGNMPSKEDTVILNIPRIDDNDLARYNIDGGSGKDYSDAGKNEDPDGYGGSDPTDDDGFKVDELPGGIGKD